MYQPGRQVTGSYRDAISEPLYSGHGTACSLARQSYITINRLSDILGHFLKGGFHYIIPLKNIENLLYGTITYDIMVTPNQLIKQRT